MPGNPYQSKLRVYEEELFAARNAGKRYRMIAQGLNTKHGLSVTHNAVFSFVKTHRGKRGGTLRHGWKQPVSVPWNVKEVFPPYDAAPGVT